jgi:hypothetical protein
MTTTTTRTLTTQMDVIVMVDEFFSVVPLQQQQQHSSTCHSSYHFPSFSALNFHKMSRKDFLYLGNGGGLLPLATTRNS